MNHDSSQSQEPSQPATIPANPPTQRRGEERETSLAPTVIVNVSDTDSEPDDELVRRGAFRR